MTSMTKFLADRPCYTTRELIDHHDPDEAPIAVTLYARRQALLRLIQVHADQSCPEARLLTAVLTRAVQDFATAKHRHEFWVNGSSDTYANAVGIEPDAIDRWSKRLRIPLRENVRRIRRRKV